MSAQGRVLRRRVKKTIPVKSKKKSKKIRRNVTAPDPDEREEDYEDDVGDPVLANAEPDEDEEYVENEDEVEGNYDEDLSEESVEHDSAVAHDGGRARTMLKKPVIFLSYVYPHLIVTVPNRVVGQKNPYDSTRKIKVLGIKSFQFQAYVRPPEAPGDTERLFGVLEVHDARVAEYIRRRIIAVEETVEKRSRAFVHEADAIPPAFIPLDEWNKTKKAEFEENRRHTADVRAPIYSDK